MTLSTLKKYGIRKSSITAFICGIIGTILVLIEWFCFWANDYILASDERGPHHILGAIAETLHGILFISVLFLFTSFVWLIGALFEKNPLRNMLLCLIGLILNTFIINVNLQLNHKVRDMRAERSRVAECVSKLTIGDQINRVMIPFHKLHFE